MLYIYIDFSIETSKIQRKKLTLKVKIYTSKKITKVQISIEGGETNRPIARKVQILREFFVTLFPSMDIFATLFPSFLLLTCFLFFYFLFSNFLNFINFLNKIYYDIIYIL